MMETQRDNNFTDKQLKGITISIKGTAKSYPFIKGWKFVENYKNYNAHLYITLIIDVEILSEEVGLEIKPYYIEQLKKGEIADSTYKRKAIYAKGNKAALTVLIKADDKAVYKNVIDLIDELNVCQVGKYAVVDMMPAEFELVTAAGAK